MKAVTGRCCSQGRSLCQGFVVKGLPVVGRQKCWKKSSTMGGRLWNSSDSTHIVWSTCLVIFFPCHIMLTVSGWLKGEGGGWWTTL